MVVFQICPQQSKFDYDLINPFSLQEKTKTRYYLSPGTKILTPLKPALGLTLDILGKRECRSLKDCYSRLTGFIQYAYILNTADIKL